MLLRLLDTYILDRIVKPEPCLLLLQEIKFRVVPVGFHQLLDQAIAVICTDAYMVLWQAAASNRQTWKKEIIWNPLVQFRSLAVEISFEPYLLVDQREAKLIITPSASPQYQKKMLDFLPTLHKTNSPYNITIIHFLVKSSLLQVARHKFKELLLFADLKVGNRPVYTQRRAPTRDNAPWYWFFPAKAY